jgi:hypothetical protein
VRPSKYVSVASPGGEEPEPGAGKVEEEVGHPEGKKVVEKVEESVWEVLQRPLATYCVSQ